MPTAGLHCLSEIVGHRMTPFTSSGHLEPMIRRIGREIFERAIAHGPSIFSPRFWQQLALDWLTKDADLKLRLFRFI
jgi:hypothetical protein